MKFSKRLFKKLTRVLCTRQNHTEAEIASENLTENPLKKNTPHSKAIKDFFRKNKELAGLKEYIPKKYLKLTRKTDLEYLYLICPNVAKTVVSHLKPVLESNKEQVVCETNAGFGLIATELLENGIQIVRFYESCPEFRDGLKDFDHVYPGRVELFTKNILHLNRYAYMDKYDRGNRVDSLLKNVPKRSWNDEPAMTIVGPMPTLGFIKFLINSLALQNDIVNYGRIQLFAIMKPRHFAVLSATPKDNLDAYQKITILFNLLFDYELLDKFPRNVFLPWEKPPTKILLTRYPAKLEPDKLYLVRINFKKTLPLPTSHILPLFYFVNQFYARGTNRVIPIIEKWVPGCGLNILLPKLKHDDYFDDLDIFTKFRELTPNQILAVFKEMINNPGYLGSPFRAMIDSELVKLETIETSLNPSPQIEKNVGDEFEEKFH